MGRVGQREALNAAAMAFEAGVTHFDVARSYGFGDAERVLGKFLATRRGRATVATKFGIRPQPLGIAGRLARPLVRSIRKLLPGTATLARHGSASMLAAGHYSLGEARSSVETSLRELKVETIDLLFVHDCTLSTPVGDDVIAWLQDLRTQGKIRGWGFATGGSDADHYRNAYRSGDAVFQRELRLQDLSQPDQGVICHSPFALLRRSLGTDGPAHLGLVNWARARGLQRQDLQTLMLEALLHAGDGRVILCAMFQPEHVRMNTQCLVRPRVDAGLRKEFLQVISGHVKQS